MVPSGKGQELVGNSVGVCVIRKIHLDESPGIKSFAYRSIHDCWDPREWELGKSSYQFEDLELILWDVVWPDWLRFDLRWDRSRSWLGFALDDGSLVNEGNLATSFRR